VVQTLAQGRRGAGAQGRKGTQGDTRGHKGTQGDTRGHKGTQGVKGSRGEGVKGERGQAGGGEAGGGEAGGGERGWEGVSVCVLVEDERHSRSF